MADEILVQYKADVSGFHASMKSVQSDLKTTESVGAKSGKSVEDSFKKTEVATESLRSKIRKLREELANATDPKDIERLAKETGKLTDQMQDAGEAARVFSSESKFEQVGTALGGIIGKLRNLDFKGASDQAKLLGSVISSLSVKDIIGGIKDMGKAFLDVGKALLNNPIFILAAALTAIGFVIKDLVTDSAEFKAANDAVNESLKVSIDNVNTLTNKYEENLIKLRQLNGELSETDAKRLTQDLKNTQARKVLSEKFAKELVDLAKTLNLDITKLEGNRFDEVYRLNYDDFKNRKFFNIEARKLEEQHAKEVTALVKLGVSENQIIKKEADISRINKEKELNDKLKAEAEKIQKTANDLQKRRDEEILKRQKDEDARLLKLSSDGVKERAKMLADQQAVNAKKEEDQIKEANDRKKQQEKDFNDEVAAIKKEGEAKITQDKLDAIAAREQLERDSISAIQSILGSIAQINSNISQGRINEVNEQADAEISALQRQYDSDLISKEEYERQKSDINKRAAEEERAIKRRTFEANKQISLIQTIISTAQATIAALGSIPYTPANIALAALTAAAGAAQIAVIESQPTPKFEEGGKVGGKRHSAGGTLIEAEKDEWVIRRNQAIKNNDLLSAINSGKADKFILEHYIAPALRAQQKKHSELKSQSFADNLSRSMILNSGNFKDGNLLESLKQSRKNDREIALFLAKELKQNYNSRNW